MFDFTQLIETPTIITDSSSTILDHIPSNNSERVWQPGTINNGISDLSAIHDKFLVPQIEYPPEGSNKNGSHVYFLLQVFWVTLLFCQIVLLSDINVVLMSQ